MTPNTSRQLVPKGGRYGGKALCRVTARNSRLASYGERGEYKHTRYRAMKSPPPTSGSSRKSFHGFTTVVFAQESTSTSSEEIVSIWGPRQNWPEELYFLGTRGYRNESRSPVKLNAEFHCQFRISAGMVPLACRTPTCSRTMEVSPIAVLLRAGLTTFFLST